MGDHHAEDHDSENEGSENESDTGTELAANVYHIEVDKRSLPIRMLRTFATLVWGLLTMGEAASPSNRVWKVVETSTGRVLTTAKSTYGDESDTGAELAADLEAFSPTEFALRWGFSSRI